MTALAQLIRRRRLELRLTQRAAARQASVSLATWQNIERLDGDPAAFQELTLARVAHGLGLELPAVFDVAGRPLPDPGRFDNELSGAHGGAAPPEDVEELIDELADTLRTLARQSPHSFLVVCGQAAEAAQHLVELHTGFQSDDTDRL